MKNLYTKREFLSNEMINEGWIGKLFKSLYASVVKLSKSTKGAKEIDAVYDKYIKEINVSFSKFGNIGTADAANVAIKNNTATARATGTTAAVVDNINISQKLFQRLFEDTAAPPVETPEEATKNTEEQKTLANLTPQKLEEISKLTKSRIEELKKELTIAIDRIVSNLSKNPDYASDKLKNYATIKKNEFNSYIYNQWYGVYQKTGDQAKLKEIVTAKKAAEAELKKSIEQVSSNISEQQIEIKTGTIYSYHNSRGDDIQVKVIGTAVGKNQEGRSTTNSEHRTMWKVQSQTPPVPPATESDIFWVAPSALKLAPTTTPAP